MTVEVNHLMGHILPGTFFIIYAIWWLVRTMQMYFQKPESYRNTTGKPCCCEGRGCCGRTLMEAVVLILVTAVAAAIEIYTGYKEGEGVVLGNLQHVTMYSAFASAAVTQLLVHRKVSFLPAKSDYMAVIAALLVELVLFRFHLHGRDIVDIHVHMLLVYSIMGCIVAVAIEMYCEKSVQAGIARSYSFMLQGWWFYSLAFLLYTPGHEVNVKNPENVMYTTLVYAWNIIGCLLFCSVLIGLTYWCKRSSYQKVNSNRGDTMNLLPDKRNGLDSNRNAIGDFSERENDSFSDS